MAKHRQSVRVCRSCGRHGQLGRRQSWQAAATKTATELQGSALAVVSAWQASATTSTTSTTITEAFDNIHSEGSAVAYAAEQRRQFNTPCSHTPNTLCSSRKHSTPCSHTPNTSHYCSRSCGNFWWKLATEQ